MRLESLTKDQEELMLKTRDEWINLFFSIKEIDKTEFEKGIKWIYEDLLKKKKPKVVYCQSWIEALITISFLEKNDNVRDNVWDNVRANVWASVRASVRANVGADVRDNVRANVMDNVRASVWANVRANVMDNVWANVRANFNKYYGETNSYSNFEWVSFYDYFEKIGILNDDKFKKYKKLIKSGAFQVYEFENYVFAIQPPKIMIRNDVGQLNSIETKAFEWSDGYGFYYVNGFSLSEELFNKLKSKTLILKEFLSEKNEEVKSAIIGFIQQRDGDEGIYRFFSNNLKEVDTFVDNKEYEYLKGTTMGMNIGVYTLFKGNINGVNVSYVRCYCPSTDRMFFLGTEPIYKSAKDAIASLYRIPKSLKNNIKNISRQGERYSTVFDEITTEKLKNNMFNENELTEYTTISGDEYFKLITYEY